jgi:hypothetical protein
MKKNLIIAGLVVVGLFVLILFVRTFGTSSRESAGAGLPDAASEYDQVASRSTKDVVKADKGRVFAIRVENDNTTPIYFQLYDRVTNPTGASVPVISFAVSPKQSYASGSLTLDSSFFAPALRFSTGITWSVSPNFATYASTSDATKHRVNIIFE